MEVSAVIIQFSAALGKYLSVQYYVERHWCIDILNREIGHVINTAVIVFEQTLLFSRLLSLIDEEVNDLLGRNWKLLLFTANGAEIHTNPVHPFLQVPLNVDVCDSQLKVIEGFLIFFRLAQFRKLML